MKTKQSPNFLALTTMSLIAMIFSAILCPMHVEAKGVVKSGIGGTQRGLETYRPNGAATLPNSRLGTTAERRGFAPSTLNPTPKSLGIGSILPARSETRLPATRLGTSSRLDSLNENRAKVFPTIQSRDLYQKEYSDIGRIWRTRYEKRTTPPQKPYLSSYHEHNKGTSGDFWVFSYYRVYPPTTFRYRDYCYDYYPGYSYPWVYCYYFVPIPPYCRSTGIVIVPTLRSRHITLQVPVIINHRDDYYSQDPHGRELRRTLDDICRAWETRNPYLIERHIRPWDRVAVYFKGQYAYSISGRDFCDMTYDAVRTVRTRSFEFERVSRDSDSKVTAFGKHEFTNEDGRTEVMYVAYSLELSQDKWYITKVGTSPYRFYHM